MIKSPCKDCGKYEMEFPECFDGCETIQQVQRLHLMNPEDVRDSNKYVPSEGHSFANKSKNHRAMS